MKKEEEVKIYKEEDMLNKNSLVAKKKLRSILMTTLRKGPFNKKIFGIENLRINREQILFNEDKDGELN
jgi:hypothetical protein